MTTIGFHASHEQIAPGQLLADVVHAEVAGFDAASCSDHFAPWSRAQGHSGFAWAWLGAALASTELPFGVVTSPGYRYHPAVIAQAIGTLAAMFPGRFWAAVGSGEHLNERITGKPWPDKETRQRTLGECIEVIRALLDGKTVTRRGLVQVDQARVWDRPQKPARLLLPALTPETAARFAADFDGLMTVNQPVDDLRTIVSAYRDNGGQGPAVLQIHLSWAPDGRDAEQTARQQWGTNVFGPTTMADLSTPGEFEARAAAMGDEVDAELAKSLLISSDTGWHAHRISEFIELGFDEIYLHHVGQEQSHFIDTFADEVLPQLR